MSIICFGSLKLSTTHMLVILNGSGCEEDETENETGLDLILFDMGIKFDKTKCYSFPESCNLSPKLLKIKVKFDPESKNATALAELFPWETVTGSN